MKKIIPALLAMIMTASLSYGDPIPIHHYEFTSDASDSVGAEAAIVGFELAIYGDGSGKTGSQNGTTIPGNDNVPLFELTNDPLSAFNITDLSFTIGDTNFNFDSAVISTSGNTQTSPGISATLNNPDSVQGSMRSDLVDYDLAGFAPGKIFAFSADIDGDGAGHTIEDFEHIFWNNDASSTPNSLITTTYSNGQVVSLELPDQAVNATSTYVFSASAVVPEPSAIWLFVSGMLGLIGISRRKKTS